MERLKSKHALRGMTPQTLREYIIDVCHTIIQEQQNDIRILQGIKTYFFE
jgi:hypothetical protein